MKTEPFAPSPIDSVSAWDWISGNANASKRTEVVLDHRMFQNASSNDCFTANASSPTCISAAIRSGKWKFVLGPEKQNGWFGWFSPNVTNPVTPRSPAVSDAACFPSPCLFDLDESITEHNDVAKENPDVVAAMMKRVVDLADTYHPPILNPPTDLDGYCAAISANGNVVGPWTNMDPLAL